MASNFSGIYDKIRTIIPTLTGFDVKTEVSNPYSLEDNSAHILRDGWGVRIGSATPLESVDRLPDYPHAQDFEIVLIRKVTATANDENPLIDAVKAIRDDIALIEENFTPCVFTNAEKVTGLNINSITGVENVTAGKFNHVTASIIFEISHWR